MEWKDPKAKVEGGVRGCCHFFLRASLMEAVKTLVTFDEVNWI